MLPLWEYAVPKIPRRRYRRIQAEKKGKKKTKVNFKNHQMQHTLYGLLKEYMGQEGVLKQKTTTKMKMGGLKRYTEIWLSKYVNETEPFSEC